MPKKTDTQVWFRNPDNFIREVVNVGHRFVAWDRGLLHKKKIDPVKHASTYFTTFPWVALVIGTTEQGAQEYLPGSTYGEPNAVYPVVSLMRDGITVLEHLAANPPGDNDDLCGDDSVPLDERPVAGQEHRIILIDVPDQSTGRGRAALRAAAEVQADFPDCIIHLHALYGWTAMFDMGFRSCDVDPRTDAQKGNIILPPGRNVKYESAPMMMNWIKLLNFMPADLQVPSNRCMYNMRSALWAAEFYTDTVKARFRRDPNAEIDSYISDEDFFPPAIKSSRTGTSTAVLPTDKITCNTCTLTKTCRSYREGSVCTVTREGMSLAAMMGSRSADDVLDGLASIQKKLANRLERALQEEEDFGELSPEVTKMLNASFANGIKYAKILDPGRFAAPKVNVNVGSGGAAAIGVSSERITAAEASKQIIRELEDLGFERTQITPKVVQEYLGRMYGKQPSEVPVDPGTPRVAQPLAIEGEIA